MKHIFKGKDSIHFINSLVCSLALFMVSVTAYGQSIEVNSTNYKQTIDMIGGDMERSASAIQSAQNKDDILQWSFGDINFNVCRVQYDKNQELTEGNKNWSFYNKQVGTMQAIKAINPDIKFFATMRSDYDGYGDDNNMPDWIHTYSSKATNVEKYGVFLADYCEYMSQQGVAISILSTAKEWMWHVRAAEAKDIINTLYAELDERGIEKPVIIDQGFWSITAGLTYLKDVESLGTKDMYTGFCSHNYSNLGPEKWVEITEKAVALGKPMYDDETSTGSGSPTYGEERAMFKQIDEYIKKAERYKAGLSGEVYFEIWSRGINKETRSIYFPSSGEGRRLRGYYMMKQFSNNILNHTYVTSSVNDASKLYTITFRKDDKMVLWVINESNTEYTLPIKLDQSTITSEVSSHYWTNNTPIEGLTTSYTASGNTFISTIGEESMSCFIFNVTEDAVDVCNLPQTSIIEAECYSAMEGVTTETSTEGTDNVTSIENGDWLKFESVDLSEAVTQFSARVSTNTVGGNIELRTGSETGTLIGTLAITNTGGLQNWETVTANISELSGTQDLYVVFSGASGTLFNVNWFQLQAATPSVALHAETSNKTVDLTWTAQNMEPVTQNIYRNAYFSETGKTLIAENVTGTTYSDTSVNNGETYFYWIELIDASSNLIKSNTVEAKPSIPNLALASNGSIATQSSTAYNGPPELAIDGNTDGTFGNGSVSHTENGTAGSNTLKWWQVDLQANYNIETINIYNRTGSNYGERLNNFTVEVKDANGDVKFSRLYTDYPNPLLTIETGGVIGRVVKISKTSDNGITLAEVEVYGEDASLSNTNFEKLNVEVYPNPVSNNLTVLMPNSKFSQYTIFDISGRVNKQGVITNDIQKLNIDLRDLSKGMYLIYLKGLDSRTLKLVKN
ncbi:carbohydrate-binding protein [Algibacter amylolyticus]|uniref:Carbohydrate-binding protein n=1 Tax=Algibacter amylolyticus TaxID=1608400 RepID=A0A5M7BD22_9FLAO|nr:carbohydrate-binding protein [Algibacter amylolyticus]KAA5825211.1 carbohydrate-binding protein [Algibacter amylolyticus]MBB5268667.1 O-glycosyl hydrolase [Algibacter amylolyticus]TSJ77705.1 carbohydrate-binding protein [Algibacter amylolyticus]